MIAVSAVTTQWSLHDHLVGDDHVDHLIDGGDVGVGQTELVPQAVAPDEIGDRIFELGDDRPQRGRVGRVLAVDHDVGVDAELARRSPRR